VQKTVLHVQKNKVNDILGISDFSICINKLNEISNSIIELDNTLICNSTKDILLKSTQLINNQLSTVFKEYGTYSLEDLLMVCLGGHPNLSTNAPDDLFLILKNYFHPTGYKIISRKTDNEIKNKGKKNNAYECIDISTDFKQFSIKVYGIKVILNCENNKTIIIFGILDDILINLLDDKYITDITKKLNNNKPVQVEFQNETFNTFLKSLSLKDYIICKDYSDIYTKYYGYISFNKNIKQKHISNIVKDYCKEDLYGKRNTILMLLLNNDYFEHDYLAYLLYDILSNDTSGTADTHDQIILFDSLPLSIKNNFKSAMQKTVEYTYHLSNYDLNKVPLEQQICLLNAPDKVKEKALTKLKEIKNKSEDSGVKARQYVEGLLKIPFNIYKKEPILNIINELSEDIILFNKRYNHISYINKLNITNISNNIDIFNSCNKLSEYIEYSKDSDKCISEIYEKIKNYDKKKLNSLILNINNILCVNDLTGYLLNKNYIKKNLIPNIIELIPAIYLQKKNVFFEIYYFLFPDVKIITDHINEITKKVYKLKDFDTLSKNILDNSVHGHNNAKRQVQRIIGQWINNNGISCDCQVLGFEGNPGVGKTTLAKDLSKCLVDENNENRPFSIIAMGGDSNASSLVGHSYTYVGSNWGQIIQILMDTKCLNPIILIDEVDKISKTEQGREIIGVLTHLLDPSQNKQFQDKYFTGIDIDLSKVLFILSYNDPHMLDPIMLDRVHRIKFDSLTIDDKLIICNKYILPELYKKFNLENCIKFPDDVLKFIIKEYTLEPGVRKLKEKLFEIIGELNLTLFNECKDISIPIILTEYNIKNKYFKDKRENKLVYIHSTPTVGMINALWANDMGQGGILPLQVSYYPTSSFLDLKLTGSLGDVMKESINVSVTIAWNLCTPEKQTELINKYNDTKNQRVFGLHIHCPSISTKKDGPSATTAFAVIIYSLFNNIPIKNNFGITGESSFDYKLTEIGGLREKIIFSIPSGITDFIFPKENKTDFDKILEKYKDNDLFDGINFFDLENISEVLDMILDK
jgi:ATP-dependent Lon protease